MSNENDSPIIGAYTESQRQRAIARRRLQMSPPVAPAIEIPVETIYEGVEEEVEEDEEPSIFSQQLVSIEDEANRLLEKLTEEFDTIRARITDKAEQDLHNAQQMVEHYQIHAMRTLEKEYSSKRDTINATAQKQIQFLYSVAEIERNRRSPSPKRIWTQQAPFNRFHNPGATVQNLNSNPQFINTFFNAPEHHRQVEQTQQFIPTFSTACSFPLIYHHPYQVPSMTIFPTSEFPHKNQ